ncbi:MAG TPA: hypothetical protein VNH83_21100, partial [Bryobacteraceae bacterium]|nr:hypothetical protein [Bryobacteraceae bacterium]
NPSPRKATAEDECWKTDEHSQKLWAWDDAARKDTQTAGMPPWMAPLVTQLTQWAKGDALVPKP